MNTRYEVLDSLPVYGDMAVPIVEEGCIFVSEGYVIKFYRDDGTSWIANFPKGMSDLSFAKMLPRANYILVVAGGDGYLMNPNLEKPIKTFSYDATAMIERDNGKLILASLTDIIFLDEDGEIEWETERMSWDGIKNLTLEGNILTGYGYDICLYNDSSEDDAWVKFSINIETREIDGGGYNAQEPEEKKPWWKFFL